MFKIFKNGKASFGTLKTTFNGAVLDDVLSNTDGSFKTVKVYGRELLSEEHTATDVPGRDGSYYISRRYLPREIEVVAIIRGNSAAQMDNQFTYLTGLLDTEKPAVLSFSDEPDHIFYGKYTSAERPDVWKNEAVIKLTFTCYDPFKYSNVKNASGNSLTYNGRRAYRPKITLTLTSSGSELKLSHTQSGRFVRIKGNYVSGQKIVFDMASGAITQNGADIVSQFDMLGSRKISLVRGRNDFVSSIPASISVEYREVFI